MSDENKMITIAEVCEKFKNLIEATMIEADLIDGVGLLVLDAVCHAARMQSVFGESLFLTPAEELFDQVENERDGVDADISADNPSNLSCQFADLKPGDMIAELEKWYAETGAASLPATRPIYEEVKPEDVIAEPEKKNAPNEKTN